jgi:hypothetical protein
MEIRMLDEVILDKIIEPISKSVTVEFNKL